MTFSAAEFNTAFVLMVKESKEHFKMLNKFKLQVVLQVVKCWK